MSCRTSVGALPTQPTISFRFTTQFRVRARGSQQTRLVWSEEALGAAPRRATNFIYRSRGRADAGTRLLSGPTQVQFLPGAHGWLTGQAHRARLENDATLQHGLACKSSAIRHFSFRPIAQKESNRPTSGRPWSVTTSGDHFLSAR